jgi:tRNA-uridine 2-sulfurtransferase
MVSATPLDALPVAATTEANTVAVAMSGGVDSSAVAALLCQQNRNVLGLTMQLWNQRRLPELEGASPAQHRCCSFDDVYDAKRVAQHLNIPHYVVNFEAHFEEKVVRPFVDQYLSGRTPIACTNCNTDVKFEPLLRMARQIGAAKLATGHYARIRKDEVTERWELLRARNDGKDQSYFLWGLTQEQLSRSEFPLGERTKEEVRDLARAANLPVAEKPESMELCFVPGGNYVQFIQAYSAERGISLNRAAGEIVNDAGEVIGHHNGVHNFTIGQRKGLGFAAGKPRYVSSIDPAANRVVVGDDSALCTTVCEVENVNWVSIAPTTETFRAYVKIRHKHEAAPAIAELLRRGSTNGTAGEPFLQVTFDAPQRAITRGQGAVLYDGDRVLAGGWIR